MAIINSLAIGKARKSAGNLRYQTVKGRTIVAQKPTYVANPNTPKQKATRGKLSNVVMLYRALSGIVASSIKVKSKYASVYNQFCTENIKNMPTTPALNVDSIIPLLTEPIIYSNGTIPAPSVTAPVGGYLVDFTEAINYLEVGDYVEKTYYSELDKVFVNEKKTLTAEDMTAKSTSFGLVVEDTADAAFYLVKANGKDSSMQSYKV